MERGPGDIDITPTVLERVPTLNATLVGRLYRAHRKRGGSRDDFVDFFAEAGYALPPATLKRWKAGVESSGEVLSASGKRGPKSKLSDEHKRLLCGFVFDRQCMGSKTKLDDVVDFCAKELEIPVHVATASRLMHELGFSSRKMQAKSSGFSVDVDGAVEMAYQWLAVHHNSFIPSKV